MFHDQLFKSYCFDLTKIKLFMSVDDKVSGLIEMKVLNKS